MSFTENLFCFIKPFRRVVTLKNNYRIRVKDLEAHILKHSRWLPPCFPSNNIVFEGDTQEQVLKWIEEDMKEERI